MDMSDLLTLLLVLLGVLALLGVAVHRVRNVALPHPAARADRDDRGSGLPGEPGRRVARGDAWTVRPPRRCRRSHRGCGLRLQARDGQEATRGCGRERPAETRSAGVTAMCSGFRWRTSARLITPTNAGGRPTSPRAFASRLRSLKRRGGLPSLIGSCL